MAKTTIDGLKVREPSSKRRPDPAHYSSANVVDMTTRPAKNSRTPRQQSSSQRQKMLDSIDNIRRQGAAADSFLDPVQTFDFDAEETGTLEEELNAGVEADWSDLLNDVPPTKASRKPASSAKALPSGTKSNFLEDWSDNDGKADFLSNTLSNSELTDDFDEPEEEPQHQRTPKKFRPRKKHHIGRNIAIASLCLLVIGGGVLYKWGDELISRLTGGNSGLWDAIHSMISDEIPFEADSNGRTNILVFGTEGYNMNGDTAYGEHGGSQLTDSIMVISLNQETKDVALLSLPRDLKVSMACSVGKINEVFSCNNKNGTDEEAGARALMRQVGDVLGINMQYYAHINWASLIDIIDTIGGITVTLDEDINDYGWTNAVARAGVPMEVTGEQALGLARARHGTTGGDFTRGNTQQKIVAGIVDKILKQGIGATEAFNLLNILGDNLRSNFSTDNIKAGLRVLSGFDMNNIRQVPLVDYNTNTFYMTTASINEISYVVPAAGSNNYTEIQRYVKGMFENNPTTREQARVVVYNASGRYGVAGAERDRLNEDGYNVVSVGDAATGDCLEKYCIFAASGENFPATSSALAERYGVTVRSFDELPEDITPGETDFIIILGFNEDEV